MTATIRQAARAVVEARDAARVAWAASASHDRDWDRVRAAMPADWDDREWSDISGQLSTDARAADAAEVAAVAMLRAAMMARRERATAWATQIDPERPARPVRQWPVKVGRWTWRAQVRVALRPAGGVA